MSDFMIDDALTFLCVVENGALAKACAELGVTPSVISKRLTRLENHLKVQLLHRTTRTLGLTEAGQLFHAHCKRIQAQIKDAARDISAHHEHLHGLLRINAPMSFGQVHMVPAVNDFLKQYPEMQIELILGSQYASFIHSGLDLAIFIKDVPQTDLLHSQRIALRSTGVYGSPSYLLKSGTPNTPEDLIKHNCLVHESGPAHQFGVGHKREWKFYRGQEHVRVPVAGNLRINSSQALVKAAIDGIGLVRVSSFLVTDDLASGKLVSVLSDFCPHDIEIHAAYPSQQYLPHKLKVFLDFITQRFMD